MSIDGRRGLDRISVGSAQRARRDSNPEPSASKTRGIEGNPKRFPRRRGRQPAPIAVRFWPRVARAGAADCWHWTGRIDRDGYGKFDVDTRTAKGAHQVAYELTHGALPPGQVVRHTCHNRRCANPAHLVAGTQADNVADTAAHGRTTRGRTMRRPLAPEVVATIRALAAAGENRQTLAREFGLAKTSLVDLLAGRTYGPPAPRGRRPGDPGHCSGCGGTDHNVRVCEVRP